MLLETDFRADERIHQFENFESAHRHAPIPCQHEKPQVKVFSFFPFFFNLIETD